MYTNNAAQVPQQIFSALPQQQQSATQASAQPPQPPQPLPSYSAALQQVSEFPLLFWLQ